MLHPVKNDDGPSFRVLLFYFFLLSTFSGAQTSDLICSHQPIAALAGDDVILPCRLNSSVSVSTVEWSRPDLDPKDIHVYKDGRSMPQNQNPSYRLRTKLFTSELKNGNVSLEILRVKMSDKGKYQCVLPSNKEAFIELIVGAVSTPTIEPLSNDSLSLVLSCKSKGWYPEPEVLWLDGEGNLLSAGSTETVRGPDDLYTVSSRMTVEKRHSNRFTCRVQQKNINQTREAHFDVPGSNENQEETSDDKPPDTLMSVSTILYIVLLLLLLVLLAVGVFFIYKRRRSNDPVIRQEIFLIVIIIILLLLLLLLVFFVAVSVSERLEHTTVPLNPLEILMVVCIILLLMIILVLLAIAVNIVKKLNDNTDPVKCLDIFLVVSIIVVVLLLLAFVVVSVKEMGRGYGDFIFLMIFWIIDDIDDLLFLLPDAIRNLKKQERTTDPVKRLLHVLSVSNNFRRPLLFLLLFFIAVSVSERLRYTTDPLSPLEISVIFSIIVLPMPLRLLLLDANSYCAKLRRAMTKRNQQVLSRPQNNQAESNDSPPEQSALVGRSTTDSSTKKPTETPVTERIRLRLSHLRGRQAAMTKRIQQLRSRPQNNQAESNDSPPEQIALVGPSTTDSSSKKPTETPGEETD